MLAFLSLLGFSHREGELMGMQEIMLAVLLPLEAYCPNIMVRYASCDFVDASAVPNFAIIMEQYHGNNDS